MADHLEQHEGRTHQASEQTEEAPGLDLATGQARRTAEMSLTEAAEAIQQAIRSRARLYAPAPLQHAETRLAIARDHWDAGAYEEARVVAQQALASADQALGHASNLKTLREEQRKRRCQAWVGGSLGVAVLILLSRWIVYAIRAHAASPAPSHHARAASAKSPETPSSPSPSMAAPVPQAGAEKGPSQPSKETAKPALRSSAETPAAKGGHFVKVAVARLIVRDGPGGNSPSHSRRLRRGQKVRVMKEQGAWLQVDLGQGKSGWVVRKYTTEEPAP